MNMSQCVHPLQLLFAVISSQATRQEGFGSAQIYRPALSMACHSMTCMLLATLASVALHASASEANMTKVNMSSQQQLMHGLTTGESTTGLNRSSATADDGVKTQGSALRGVRAKLRVPAIAAWPTAGQQSLVAHMNVTCVDTTSTGALGAHAIAHMVTSTGLITGVSRDLINASWSAFTDRGTTTYVEVRNVCAP